MDKLVDGLGAVFGLSVLETITLRLDLLTENRWADDCISVFFLLGLGLLQMVLVLSDRDQFVVGLLLLLLVERVRELHLLDALLDCLVVSSLYGI